MKRLGLLVVSLVTAVSASAPTLAANGGVTQRVAGSAPSSSPRSLINQYCVTCHNERRRVAGLALDAANVDAAGLHPETWEKVVAKLNANAMPPVGLPRPSEEARQAFVAWLENELDRAAAARPTVGRTSPFHRLNRTEYQNAVRDLLALDVDATAWLPGDDAAYGFDNNAEVLSMSPTLLDGYLSAANTISQLAVGDMAMAPALASYRFPTQLLQQGRLSDDLPFGVEGGVTARHYFPLDAEYEASIRLTGSMALANEIELRLDGVRVADLKKAVLDLDPDGAGGRVARARFPATAGSHVVAVVFVRGRQVAEGQFPAYFPWGNNPGILGARPYPHVAALDLMGPHLPSGPGDTPSRRRIFTCRPTQASQEEACATSILASLARQAYRRPVTQADVAPLVAFYRNVRTAGAGFEAGIRTALERLLVDPDFLYRIEATPATVAPGAAYLLTDIELASRLSFFLWSSIPDAALLAAAEKGTLRQPGELERQVRRMLADGRSTALVTSFGAQWLFQRNLQMVNPDFYAFPDWDDNLRQAMARETEMFLDSQIRSDRPIDELLTADYTFVNDRLARHYGLPNVYGSHFRRVALRDDHRRGLLGHASLLTVTSMPNRTSPVVRGKWLLENMMGYPAPAPPPNVPALSDNEKGQAPKSVRERMEQHRKNAVCASCHAVMDPIGFSLDQFDAIGRWRTRENGSPVDASGALPDGRKIDGVVGLRNLLLSRREQFVRTVTEKLLVYGLGRGAEFYDMPTVRQIAREAAAHEYTWSSVILGIVKSRPFQMRTRKG
ncbi:MAG: DUF1592 domain-containing protein [Vicinamibacterales bacterium]